MGGHRRAVPPLADVQLAWLELPTGSRVTRPIAAARSIFFYTVRGAFGSWNG